MAKFLEPRQTPSYGVNPFEFLDESSREKTRVPRLSIGEDFVILACIILTQYHCVTEGQTDGQTDGQTYRSWLC